MTTETAVKNATWTIDPTWPDEIRDECGHQVAEVMGGRWVGDCQNPTYEVPEPIKKRAILIAAAPELLKESRNVITEFFEEYEYEDKAPENSKTVRAIRKLQAAIRKATEGQPRPSSSDFCRGLDVCS